MEIINILWSITLFILNSNEHQHQFVTIDEFSCIFVRLNERWNYL